MLTFHTLIQIRAPKQKVWNLLFNVSQWHVWNTTVEKVDGSVILGKKLTVYAKVTPGKAFPLTVKELIHEQKMVWAGGMPLGLFTGTRLYTLEQRNDQVEFMMREDYSGLFAPMITKSIPNLQPSFDEFAASLKKAAEA